MSDDRQRPSAPQKNSKRSKKSSARGAEGGAEGGSSGPSALSPSQVEQLLAGDDLSGLTQDTLIALGVLTLKGGASPSAHRKLKQVKHFLQLIAPALDELFERYEEPVLVDMGAGKAAMSLAIYDRWVRAHGRGKVIAVESRPELVERVREATRAHYPRFEAHEAEILSAHLPERVHLTLALHACDLATDHAIYRALLSKSDHVALVPCCQAEFAQLLKPIKGKRAGEEASGAVASLWSDAWHRREFGAHLTNVTRALALRAMGYAVTVTELIGWEHSVKNELILARRVARFHRGARAELESLLSVIPVRPWLLTKLHELSWGELAQESAQAQESV